jgi:hypothetical protein
VGNYVIVRCEKYRYLLGEHEKFTKSYRKIETIRKAHDRKIKVLLVVEKVGCRRRKNLTICSALGNGSVEHEVYRESICLVTAGERPAFPKTFFEN